MAFWLFLSLAVAQKIADNLDFEQGETGEIPPGWFVPETLKKAGWNASTVVDGCHKGKCAGITVPESQPQGMFGNLMNRGGCDAASRKGWYFGRQCGLQRARR